MTRRRYSSSAAATTLSSSVTSGAVTIVVGAITGFPTQYPYTLILDPDTASEEVITVTAGSGTSLTVTRGSDSTTALAHTAGAVVIHGVSARDFDEPNAHINSAAGDAGLHGLTGALVGTTDTQTLTNKTLTAPVISQFGTASGLGAAWTSYTPVIGGTGWAIGNGVVSAAWALVGKSVLWRASITFGSTTTFGTGQLSVTMPTASRSGNSQIVGSGRASRGGVFYLVTVACPASSTGAVLYGQMVSGTAVASSPFTSTVPATWASADALILGGTYEAT